MNGAERTRACIIIGKMRQNNNNNNQYNDLWSYIRLLLI